MLIRIVMAVCALVLVAANADAGIRDRIAARRAAASGSCGSSSSSAQSAAASGCGSSQSAAAMAAASGCGSSSAAVQSSTATALTPGIYVLKADGTLVPYVPPATK